MAALDKLEELRQLDEDAAAEIELSWTATLRALREGHDAETYYIALPGHKPRRLLYFEVNLEEELLEAIAVRTEL